MTPGYLYNAQAAQMQQAYFYQQFAMVKKDELAGFLLALLLGTFGFHRFYLGENVAGVLYVLFAWTGIPTLLGLMECFFMPGRVRAYNMVQASQIAAWMCWPGGRDMRIFSRPY
jgi:TM2 domain-containing membrane protein YozV